MRRTLKAEIVAGVILGGYALLWAFRFEAGLAHHVAGTDQFYFGPGPGSRTDAVLYAAYYPLYRLPSRGRHWVHVRDAASTQAETLSIEDRNLIPVPAQVVSALMAQTHEGDEPSKCRYVGRPVNLSGTGPKRDDWVVTTADACHWGAAVGPLWVMQQQDSGYRLVLDTVGYTVTISTQTQHGRRDIATSAGTAGWYQESLWKFERERYEPAKTRRVDFSDPESCARNPDVCRGK